MSGAEFPASETGFAWFVSLGNILTIFSVVTSIVIGVISIGKILRKDVRDAVLESTQRIDVLADKLKNQESVISMENTRNVERISEIKWMMSELVKKIDETREDTRKTADQRLQEVREFHMKIDALEKEHYRLNVEVIKKIEEESTKTREEGRQELLDIDDIATQQRILKTMKSARTQGDQTMKSIRSHISEQDKEQREDYQQQEEEHKKRRDTTTLELERAMELIRKGLESSKAESKETRDTERVGYKEEDRLTRVDEMKDERDIRHTDERRREQYEGDAGKVRRTHLEEVNDPTSTHEEKIAEEEEEEEEEAEAEEGEEKEKEEGGGGEENKK